MIAPETPPSESERLATLRGYDILDTAPEPAFDRIVRLASTLTGAPIALVSLIDSHRQWFKACIGLEVRETSRAVSFCGHTILDTVVMVIPDARLDPRFSDNPLVVGEPGIRFYAGAPLIGRSGHALGTLCVIDTHPRVLTAEQTGRLADLAAMVVDELELRLSMRLSRQENENLKAAQQALAATEARTRSILDTAADAILTIDEQGRIETANAACQRLFGYLPDELIGRNISVLIPQDKRERHQHHLAHFPSGGAGSPLTWGREVLSLHRNGSRVPVHVAVNEMWIDGRRLFTGIVRDISDQRRIQSELVRNAALLRTVVDDSSDPIFVKNVDGRYLLANPATCRSLGVATGSMLGKTDFDLLPRALAETITRVDQELMAAGRTVTVDEVLPSPLGPRTYLSTKTPLTDSRGTTVGLVGIARDITDRKRTEEELVAAKLEAELANEAKSDFLSRMSHELRTPLNAVLGFTQMLQINEDEPLSPAQQGYVGHIMHAGHHLLDLINEILDLARIEAGKATLVIEEFEPRALLRECLPLFMPMAKEKSIGLRVGLQPDPTPRVRADRLRLRQVLVNLLSNAIKYNRPGGSVTITEQARAGDRVRLTVTDTGRGIPSSLVSQLFQPFNRLNAAHSGIEGTGIGLTIARRLVEMMGGSIGVSSREGEGSAFWVELPMVAVGSETSPFETGDSGPGLEDQISEVLAPRRLAGGVSTFP